MTNIDQFDFPQVREEEPSVNIRELVARYVYYWPVFVLGLTACLLFAFLYLRYAQPVYSVNSTLLIKDDKAGVTTGGSDLLNELDLFGKSKVVDNEIEILKSKTLMRKVVDRLNLSVSIKAEGRVRSSDLYVNKPVSISVVEMDSAWFGKTLELSFPGTNLYELLDKQSGKKVRGILNQLQRNVFGIYKIDRTSSFNLSSRYRLSCTINDPLLVTEECLNSLTINLSSKQSTVVNLSYQAAVPQQGQDILNTLVQVYNEAALVDKNQTTQSTIEFIDERLKLITGELTEVERDVESFKSTRGLTDITNDANLFLENVRVNDAKLSEVNLQISVIKDIQRYINSSSPNEKLPSTLGINDPVLLGQITQLADLQLQRDRLLETTTEGNPLVAPIAKQIETTRAGIKSSIGNISKTLEVSRADLEGNNSQFQGSIKKIPGQERQLISIKRQQTIKESLYLYLLQKKEEAALSYASAVADSRVVDPAYYSKSAIKPKTSVTVIMSLLLGIILPISYVYIKFLFNDRIQSLADVIKLTSTPILGDISYDKNAAPIVVLENSRKAIAEQFRSIRTNMQFLTGSKAENSGRVTLITSSISGEGKTFIATNIAASLAIGGKKTVLLELDLRKPKVSRYLKLNNSIGLSNYLIKKATIEDIIIRSDLNPNLYVLGSGPIPPNPSELLVLPELDNLVAYLKVHFDEILIDTPPIGLVTDAQIVSRVADSSIYVVREGLTLISQVKNLNSLYKSRKLPNLNLVLNGVEASRNYGYGYGYGYYSDDTNDRGISRKHFFRDITKRF